MSNTESPVLQVNGLTASYGQVRAVIDAHIAVQPASIVTVIGANGAGKSTLLNAVMGSLPANGSSTGIVQYRQQDVAAWPVERRVAQGMSLVPESRELFASMTVEDNLLLGAFRLYRAGRADWRSGLDDVYDLFPVLAERKWQQAGTLSGGERQMLAVGRALMARPQLLMLDEPSLGLAPRIVREIFHIIARLRGTGVAILLVEQNARAALQVADYGYVLETGRIILEGSSSDLATDQRIIDSYLGLGGGQKDRLAD